MTRQEKTLAFIQKHFPEGSSILDLGVSNELGDILSAGGFKVSNTLGEDLDSEFQKYADPKVDLVTAFQIFEHMLAPYNILKSLQCENLIASVPLDLWFAKAYWNKTEIWDRHYHEFEPRQFDMLLERTGWKIIDSAKWTSPAGFMGIRPILRSFTPRHYIVFCKRENVKK